MDELGVGGTGIGASAVDKVCKFSSTLAAGVKGGSAARFIGTTGVNAGEMVGNATDCADGVDRGVTILEASGMEL